MAQITTDNAVRRRKRRSDDQNNSPPGGDEADLPFTMLEFIAAGGTDGLYEELPHILVPLLVSTTSVYTMICFQVTISRSNYVLYARDLVPAIHCVNNLVNV